MSLASQRRFLDNMNPYRNKVIFAAGLLIFGDFLDSSTTIIGLVYYRGIEGSNVWIRYFMYTLNWGLIGLVAGLLISWSIDIILLVVAFRGIRPNALRAFEWVPVALFFMILYGAAYTIVGLINLATLVRLGI